MKTKTILLASFIFPERKEWFLNYLEEKFRINSERVFGYENLDDESKIIVTFKFKVKEGKYVNFKDIFPNATTIHKRGNALYTINALNKLIENMHGDNIGNIDNKSVQIDWDEYQNKFILTSKEELLIYNIKRIF
jgi:hypothetical protein